MDEQKDKEFYEKASDIGIGLFLRDCVRVDRWVTSFNLYEIKIVYRTGISNRMRTYCLDGLDLSVCS